MGTRGILGYVIDGQEKLSYNHFDSYPSGLGVEVLSWLKQANLDEVRQQVRELYVVKDGEKPTPETVQTLARYTDLGVSTQSTDDWYCLLRETQGNPALQLKAGFIEDASTFPLDSLFCEYGYVIDLDANVLEVYEGFQHHPHEEGRFANRNEGPPRERAGGNQYYPIKLIGTFPLDNLPTEAAFLAQVDPDE